MSGHILNNFVKGSGLVAEHIQGGATVAAYSVVYINATGRWVTADADALATMPVVGLATEPLRVGQRGRVLVQGFASSNTWTWTPGALLYASTVAGALTETAPVGVGDVVQEIGIAFSATEIYFNGAGLGSSASGASNTLEGETAFVGFDVTKSGYVNYFLCDGTADDVQIQEAVDYVYGLGGGIVQLESGTYSITATVNVYQYIWIKGNGQDKTQLNQDFNGDMFNCITYPASGVTIGFVHFSDMTMFGRYLTHAAGHGIRNVNFSDCEYNSLYIYNFSEAGIRLDDQYFHHIHDCWLEGNAYGAYILAGSNFIMNNTLSLSREDNLYIAGQGAIIEGNRISQGQKNGISTRDPAGSSINSIIQGNSFDLNGQGAANTYYDIDWNGNGVLIHGNAHRYCADLKHIIRIWDSDGGIIKDNVFSESGTSGYITITANSTGTIIKDNTGFQPIGIIANPFSDTADVFTHEAAVLGGAAAAPTASTDYTVQSIPIIISSTDSANTDCAIVIKDPAGNSVLQAALSTVDYLHVPPGYMVNWGAFTGAAPTVTVSFL